MKKVSVRKAQSEPMRFHPFLSITTFFLGIIAMFVIQQVFAHGGNTNFIHSCVHKGDGNIRIIDANGNCKPEETPLDWNIQGPPGVAGPQGPAGNGYFGLPFFCDNCYLSPYASKFAGRDFSYASIQRSTFDNATLTNVIFQNTYLDNTSFNKSDLTGADISNLQYPPYKNGNTNLSFTGANLTNTNFSNDTLQNGDFSNAILQNTNFSNASLRYVNFSGAKQMSTANISNTTWVGVTCPDGTNSDNHGNTCVGHF